MHHKLESPDSLKSVQNELTAEITRLIDDIKQEKQPETGKKTPFDEAVNTFLELKFIEQAKIHGACYVPLRLPDVSSNLGYLNPDYVTQPHLPADDSNGSEAALPVTKITSDEFWRNITSVHEMARPLRLPDPDVYVVPLRSMDPNQDGLSKPGYSRESMALDAAHFKTKSLARQLVMKCTNPLNLPSSKLSPEIQSLQDTLIRIIDKKAEAGWRFINQYLEIIAPESKRSLDQYLTVGDMLTQKKSATNVQQNPDPRLEVSKTKFNPSQGQHANKNNTSPNDKPVNVPLATKRGGEENWDKVQKILTVRFGLPALWVRAYEWDVQKTPEDQSARLTAQACLKACTQPGFTEIVEAYKEMTKQQG